MVYAWIKPKSWHINKINLPGQVIEEHRPNYRKEAHVLMKCFDLSSNLTKCYLKLVGLQLGHSTWTISSLPTCHLKHRCICEMKEGEKKEYLLIIEKPEPALKSQILTFDPYPWKLVNKQIHFSFCLLDMRRIRTITFSFFLFILVFHFFFLCLSH